VRRGLQKRLPVNITIFAIADFPEGPATTSRIKLLCQMLIEAGHQVSLAIYHANAKVPLERNSKVSGDYGDLKYEYLNGKTVRPGGVVGALIDNYRGLSSSLKYLFNKKCSRDIDLVIFYTPDILMSLPCLLLSKVYRLPVILELCEIFSSNDDKLLKNRIKQLGSVVTEKFAPKICSGLLVVSSQIFEFVRKNGVPVSRIFHLPILVDFNRVSSVSKESVKELLGKKYFLNSGTLEEKDGIKYILEAFSAIHKTHDDVYLVFTGGAHPQRMKMVVDDANEFGLGGRIIFTGFIPEEQLVWSYQNALALLCCRSNNKFTNFGFPTKIAEYLSSGVPVITTYVGDVSLYLKDRYSAFIAEPENSQSIKECMELIVNDPELASRVGVEGQNVAIKQFDYKNFIVPIGKFLKVISTV
jgi:glycosyltransferase involved in cell wall biosynthesis